MHYQQARSEEAALCAFRSAAAAAEHCTLLDDLASYVVAASGDSRLMAKPWYQGDGIAGWTFSMQGTPWHAAIPGDALGYLFERIHMLQGEPLACADLR